MRCTYYIEKGFADEVCAILTECKCEGCKFRKTDEQLRISRKKAEISLKKKGLRKVKKVDDNGELRISVEEVTEE